MTLALWTYSKDEWKAFLRSTNKKGPFLAELLHFFLPKRMKSAPVIRITPERICIGNDQQYFNCKEHTLKKVTIAEAGSVNILAIRYEIKDGHTGSSNEIRIPVPKGKLREAIEVEKKLTDAMSAIQPG